MTNTPFVCNGINGLNGAGGGGKNWQTAAHIASGDGSKVAFEAADTRRYNLANVWASFELAGLFTCFDKLCSVPKVRMNNICQAMLVWAGNVMSGNLSVVRRGVFASHYNSGAWETAVELRSGVFNTTGEVQTPDVAFDAAGNTVTV